MRDTDKLEGNILKGYRKNETDMEIYEKTPKSLRCLLSACPAIFETDRDSYVVIGTRLSLEVMSKLLYGRVGEGEVAVEFPKALLQDVLKTKS